MTPQFEPMRLITAYQGRDYVSLAAAGLQAHLQILWPHSIHDAATKVKAIACRRLIAAHYGSCGDTPGDSETRSGY
jgi:hypothetical protein